MDEAYRGKVRGEKRLEEKRGEFILGFEDLAKRLKERPKREEVEALAPKDPDTISAILVCASPRGRREEMIWGYLSSLAAERLSSPLVIPPRNYAGLEMRGGTIILEGTASSPGSKAGFSSGSTGVGGSVGEGSPTWGRRSPAAGS